MDSRIRSIRGVSSWLVFVNGNCLGSGKDSRCHFEAVEGDHQCPHRLRLDVELLHGDRIDIVNLNTKAVFTYAVIESIPANSDIDLNEYEAL